MTHSLGYLTAVLTTVATVLLATGCGARTGGIPMDTLGGAPISADVLQSLLGKVEDVSSSTDVVASGKALESARTFDYGRPGKPEVALVRTLESPTLVPVNPGTIVWVFHWGGLGEQEPVAIPGNDGSPQETVFIHDNYFVVVEAKSGETLAGILTK
jgi:hypothetical protein